MVQHEESGDAGGFCLAKGAPPPLQRSVLLPRGGWVVLMGEPQVTFSLVVTDAMELFGLGELILALLIVSVAIYTDLI